MAHMDEAMASPRSEDRNAMGMDRSVLGVAARSSMRALVQGRQSITGAGGGGGLDAARPVFADAEAMKARLREKMCAPQYDVTDLYHEHGVFQAIARNRFFQNVTLLIIGLNAVWIWIDTDFNKSSTLLDALWPFQFGEHLFCLLFSFEWFIRFMSFRRKRDGARDAWFVFDSLMVGLMVLETWVMTVILVFLGSPEGGSVGNAGMMRLLRLLRLSRMARMARLLRAMPELLILIKGMMAATRSVLFTLILLLVVLYLFGIAFVQLLGDMPEKTKKGFTTVPEAMHTLLLRGTLMDDIAIIVRQLSTAHIIYAAVFYFFVLISALTVMNMLIGVLCEVVNAVAAAEREELTVAYVKAKLQDTLRQGGLDQDGDGTISREEFAQILDNAHAVRTLTDVGVDVFNLVDLQDFIFECDDESGEKAEKELTFGDFMEVVLQLRGTNQATVKDVVDLRKFVGLKSKEIETRILGALRRSGMDFCTESRMFDNSCFSRDNNSGLEPIGTWRVVCAERVGVQADANLQSSMISSKAPGDVVRGRRSDDGVWVQLVDEPGFLLLTLPDSNKAALERVGGGGTAVPLGAQIEDKLRRLRHQLDWELKRLAQDLRASANRLPETMNGHGGHGAAGGCQVAEKAVHRFLDWEGDQDLIASAADAGCNGHDDAEWRILPGASRTSSYLPRDWEGDQDLLADPLFGRVQLKEASPPEEEEAEAKVRAEVSAGCFRRSDFGAEGEDEEPQKPHSANGVTSVEETRAKQSGMYHKKVTNKSRAAAVPVGSRNSSPTRVSRSPHSPEKAKTEQGVDPRMFDPSREFYNTNPSRSPVTRC